MISFVHGIGFIPSYSHIVNHRKLFFREFLMAEIEHFVNPDDKSHPKFADVSDTLLPLFSACNQMDGKPMEFIKVGDAVGKVSKSYHVFKLNLYKWYCHVSFP